jgi:hypothetical protein
MSDFIHEFNIVRVYQGQKYPDRWKMQYSLSEPFTVRLLFPEHGADVVWLVDRELLWEGLSKPAGEGDVHVFTSRDIYVMSISTPEKSVILEANLENVRAFLEDTLAAVPLGTEVLDLDSELAALFS